MTILHKFVLLLLLSPAIYNCDIIYNHRQECLYYHSLMLLPRITLPTYHSDGENWSIVDHHHHRHHRQWQEHQQEQQQRPQPIRRCRQCLSRLAEINGRGRIKPQEIRHHSRHHHHQHQQYINQQPFLKTTLVTTWKHG